MKQEGFKRKLTAIFSADACGYNRLMGEDESAVIRTLTSYRNEVSSLIKQHKYSVFLFMLTAKSLILQTDFCINPVSPLFQERD